ncbi:MAG: hypothetical protein IT452_01750 [Planctomycetia bacterium]|nr:hypothetical protein [Planctomycetia bacterium]
MTNLIGKAAAAAVLALSLAACAEDKESSEGARVVKLAVTGVQAGCCDSAVADEVKKIAGVASVAFEEDKTGKRAVIRLKPDSFLSLSKMQEALKAATASMGKAMGLEYKLDEAKVPVDAHVAFRTGPIADKAALDKALAALKGFESSSVEEGKAVSTLTLKFKEGEAGNLKDALAALKDAKVDVKDVDFLGAPTKK